MSFRVLAFNTHAGFADRNRSNEVVDFVIGHSPDIAFFPDAYPEHRAHNEQVVRAVSRLSTLGYEVTHQPNNDQNDRTDRAGFMGIIRRRLGTGSVLATAVRSSYLGTLTDPASGTTVRYAGVHLDDQNEAARLAQLAALPQQDIIFGDFNAMPRTSLLARLLTLAAPTVNLLPEINPDPAVTTNRLALTLSNLQRLSRMADGRTLDTLTAQGLRDADNRQQPTIHGMAQLDHIFVAPHLTVTDFTVHRGVDISDHKPISATLQVRTP